MVKDIIQNSIKGQREIDDMSINSDSSKSDWSKSDWSKSGLSDDEIWRDVDEWYISDKEETTSENSMIDYINYIDSDDTVYVKVDFIQQYDKVNIARKKLKKSNSDGNIQKRELNNMDDNCRWTVSSPREKYNLNLKLTNDKKNLLRKDLEKSYIAWNKHTANWAKINIDNAQI
jgi:hypothetical protein